MRGGKCLDCQVDSVVEPYAAEYVRLQRKLRNYSRLAANLNPLRRQIERIELRISRQIAALTPDLARAQAQAARTKERLRNRVSTIHL